MFSKRSIGPIFGIIVGLPATLLTTFFLYQTWHVPTIYLTLFFIVLSVLFSRLGMWILVEHPEELEKKYPMSGNELRRRRRRFYAWLDSLDRRR